MSEEPLPPLPTKIRFDARYRDAPRGRKDLSLILFVGCVILVFAFGLRGMSSITQFLDLTKRNLERRSHQTPQPEPTPEIEIRFQPSQR